MNAEEIESEFRKLRSRIVELERDIEKGKAAFGPLESKVNGLIEKARKDKVGIRI